MKIVKRFGIRLRSIRLQRRLTIREMAYHCCVSERTWRRWEMGVGGSPSLKTLGKVAAGLGMNVSGLLEGV